MTRRAAEQEDQQVTSVNFDEKNGMVSTEKLPVSTLGKAGKLCPRCGRPGSFHIKEFLGKGGRIYRYWYTAHYRPKNGKKSSIKWCYVGKSLPSSSPEPANEDAATTLKPINSSARLYLNCKDASGKQQHPVQLSQIRHNREKEKQAVGPNQ